MHGGPFFVVLVETFLDASTITPTLTGYVLVARRDRGGLRRKGGVAVFAKMEVARYVVFLENSEVSERSWLMIHSDNGPILFGAWYRRPSYGEVASIDILRTDIERLGTRVIGIVICGDMNVHHVKWLQFSRGISPAGRRLHEVCLDHELEELTQKPTRGAHLLDLTLTDLGSHAYCTVLLGVSDHQMVLMRLDLPLYSDRTITRACFSYHAANWTGLNRYFMQYNWAGLFDGQTIDDMVIIFTNFVLEAAKSFIPFEWKEVNKKHTSMVE